MGSWGYGPFDSDDSRWVLYEIDELLAKKLKNLKLNSGRDYHDETDVLGAIHTLTTIAKAFGDSYTWMDVVEDESLLDNLHKLILEIENDEEWMENWQDPAAIKRSVRKQRKAFEDTFSEYLYE